MWKRERERRKPPSQWSPHFECEMAFYDRRAVWLYPIAWGGDVKGTGVGRRIFPFFGIRFGRDGI